MREPRNSVEVLVEAASRSGTKFPVSCNVPEFDSDNGWESNSGKFPTRIGASPRAVSCDQEYILRKAAGCLQRKRKATQTPEAFFFIAKQPELEVVLGVQPAAEEEVHCRLESRSKRAGTTGKAQSVRILTTSRATRILFEKKP